MRVLLLERGIVLPKRWRLLAGWADAPVTAGEPDPISPRMRRLVAGASAFRRVRDWAARLGLVPKQAATETRLGHWLRGLLARAHKNTIIVALANKLARII